MHSFQEILKRVQCYYKITFLNDVAILMNFKWLLHHDHVGDGGRVVRVALAADQDAADVVLLQVQLLADLRYCLACVVELQDLLYLPCDLFPCFFCHWFILSFA